jgi:hypothetical protein
MQTAAHHASTQHSVISPHSRVSDTSPNQGCIRCKNRALSSANIAGTVGQEAERSRSMTGKNGGQPQSQRSQRAAPGTSARKPQGHRKTVQEIEPQSSRIRATRRGSFQGNTKCWTQRQQRSTKAYPPAVAVGSRVQTWRLERGQNPCNGGKSHGTE